MIEGSEISDEAFGLIVECEVTDQRTYTRRYQATEWPGVSSGVTVGIGYDVGYATKAQLWDDWAGVIPDAMISKLERAIGVTGQRAKSLASALKSEILIPWEAALAVHRKHVLPRWIKIVKDNLPNVDVLGPDCLGALTSLTYNRGPSFNKAGVRYREMRAIKDHMAEKDFGKIPTEIKAMKRLWPGVGGLLDRRDKEADLFERGLSACKTSN